VSEHRDFGTTPVRLFELRRRYCNFLKVPKAVGIDPTRLLPAKDRAFNTPP